MGDFNKSIYYLTAWQLQTLIGSFQIGVTLSSTNRHVPSKWQTGTLCSLIKPTQKDQHWALSLTKDWFSQWLSNQTTICTFSTSTYTV